MGLLQESQCVIVANARRMARSKGLDPHKVDCSLCTNGTDCPFSPDQLPPGLVEDIVQDAALARVEKQVNLDKFYQRLKTHAAIVEGSSQKLQ